ncbi:cell division protein FtsZ [Ahrensia sp. R2A130]|uniref:cell division protein FtsZ n=1 Tax=Ahrensia sp. R2A130 TaxID=744979 RepID=UPI0001E0C9C4|nr:cell division protein FtsZ [Ahrensia sp. R2A130]EFL90837.1 cell division protein FtsZ [Ahrensia sp. R2A130]
MTINLQKPEITELKPRITVFGVGGGGCNAVNNMITSGLDGVDFVVANTDAQALSASKAERMIQMGVQVTEGLGAGSQPEVGAAAAEESLDEIKDHLTGTHMCFVTAGMGGGTGTGAAPVVARAAREAGILTVGVVTKPFSFEGARRMKLADAGIGELQKNVDTLIVIPNQNLFRVADEKTTFAGAFAMADQVLYSGVACITDLMVKEGLINLDFADVRSVMREMGRAMMGTGEASGDGRAMAAAEAAISNPLLDETSMAGSQGLLISITGGKDMTLFEVDEAATRIREEVDSEANIILGATFDESLEGVIRVSVVATGIDGENSVAGMPDLQRMNDAAERLRQTVAPKLEAAPAPTAEALGVAQVEAELALPSAIEIERPAHSEIAAPVTAEIIDPISDAEFQSALEAQIAAPTPSEPVQLPIAHRDTATQQNPPAEENGPLGMFRKLANTIGGHGATEPASAPAPVATRSVPVTAPAPAPIAAPAAPRADASPYAAPRNAGLDIHGRPAATARPLAEEDQLDIPAFLRRQSN